MSIPEAMNLAERGLSKPMGEQKAGHNHGAVRVRVELGFTYKTYVGYM